MKKYLEVILLVSLVINGSHAQTLENQDSRGISYLTIEQSLLPLTDVSYFVSGDFPFNRINPAIKEYLFYYLENDNSIGEITDYSLRLLGYVATKDDIPFIDNFIQTSIKRANAGNPDDRNAGILLEKVGSGSGCLIGIMVKRKIEGARELLNKYMDSSLWLSGITNESAKRKPLNSHRDFLVQAYQYSMDSAVLKAMENELSKGRIELGGDVERFGKWDTDIYSKSIKPVDIREEILQQKLNDDLLKNHRGIEPILQKITYQQWIEKQEGRSSITRRAPQTTTESVMESIILTDPNQVGCLESAATQAIKAYLGISERLSAGKFSEIINKLLDNGKLIDSEKLKRVENELTRGLQLEQAIVADVKKAELNKLSDFSVNVELNSDISSFTAEIGKEDTYNVSAANHSFEMMGHETAIVTFIIPGTAEIYKKHIPNPDGVTTCESGDLKVYMKRINGKWYWNPFGW